MPLMEMFDQGIQLRMGQCNVKRWIDEICRWCRRRRPARHRGPAPTCCRWSRRRRVRDVPEEGGRLRQGRADPVSAATAGTRVVVVTGASSGIGRATAARLREPRRPRRSSPRGPRPAWRAVRAGVRRGGQDRASCRPTSPTATARRRALRRRGRRRFGRVDAVGAHARRCSPTGASRRSRPRSSTRSCRSTCSARPAVGAGGAAALPRPPGGGSLILVGSLLGQHHDAVHELVTSRASGGCTAWRRALQQEARRPPGVEMSAWSPRAAWTPRSTSRRRTTLGRIGRPPPPVTTPRAGGPGHRALRGPTRAGRSRWAG